MCDYFSGIITKGGKVLVDDSNSHSRILDKHKIDDKKIFQDFLPFEIKKTKDNTNEYSKPTEQNWELLFQNSGGQGTFKIPIWYKASFDRRIWSVFKDTHNKKIKAHQEEEKAKKRLELADRKQAMLESKQKDSNGKAIIPKFKIVLAEPAYLKDSINVIKDMITEARITVTKTKMEITATDPANVAMVIWKLLSSVAVEWIVKKQFSFAINIEHLHSLLKNCKANDLIEITNHQSETDKLIVCLKGKSRREYSIEVIELEDKINTIPTLKFEGKITMPSTMLEEQIREANNTADSVIFEVTKKGFEIKAESDYNKLRISNPNNDEVSIKSDSEFKTKYSTEYLLKFVGCKKLCDTAILEFNKDYPLKVSYKLLDKLSFEWILAPRVSDD